MNGEWEWEWEFEKWEIVVSVNGVKRFEYINIFFIAAERPKGASSNIIRI